MLKTLRLSALLIMASLLTACASMPTGPSMMVLPGSGKSFDQFRNDDYICRQFANEQIGGATPNRASISSGVGSAVVGAGLGAAAGVALGGERGAVIGAGSGLLAGGLVGTNTARASGSVAQQRYDTGYIQCMYAMGHYVPVSGQVMSGSPTNGGYQGGGIQRPPLPGHSIPPPPPGYPPPPPPR